MVLRHISSLHFLCSSLYRYSHPRSVLGQSMEASAVVLVISISASQESVPKPPPHPCKPCEDMK